MMHSTFGTNISTGALPPSYPYDTLFDNTYTTQMALSQVSRKLSRGSNGQRVGTAMRVVKPTSANNSPRSSMTMARRRTMVNDGQATRRHQQAVEYISSTHDVDVARTRQPRPVSWHPSTHVPPQPHYSQPATYNLATSNIYADQREIYSAASQYSPMMTSYSNNTSPASTFSPLPASYQVPETSTHLSMDGWQAAQRSSFFPPVNDCQYMAESCSTLNGTMSERTSGNALDWNSFVMHGFNNTSPPTPDSFVQNTQQPQHAVPEASIQSLDDSEEEGEILIGMGLYDTPDKYREDPHLNNYRSTVSSLLGSTFRHQEPRGKGLKLEETWEPPKSDDEDEDEEGSEN